MKLMIERGAASVILHVFVQDSSATDGSGLAGLAYDSAGLTCAKVRGGETLASPTFQDITTLGTYESPTANTQIRFKQVHATNAPGWYEVHLHNDWVDATNTRRTLVIMLFGAANMAPVNIEIELTGFSLQGESPDTIADAVLKRDWTSVTGEAARSLLNAARFLRNKWAVAAGTLTVYEEDDATPAWTGAVSTNAAAEPVIGNDPA